MRQSATKRRLPAAAVLAFAQDALGTQVTACEERKDGFFNTAYALTLKGGERLVLKIAPPPAVPVLRDEIRLMDNEIAALEAARAAGMPAPALAGAYDASCPLGSPCLFMTYLEGTPFERLERQLDDARVQAVYRQLGALMHRLHANTGQAYGRLIDRYDTWPDAFFAMAENLARDARQVQAAPAAVIDAFLALARREEAALAEVRRPALLHRDLWFGNLLVEESGLRLVGLIDWERAQYGDPLLEFVFGFIEGASAYARGRAAFGEGYGRRGGLSEPECARVRLYTAYYQCILLVEGYFRGYGTQASAKRALSALEETLSR